MRIIASSVVGVALLFVASLRAPVAFAQHSGAFGASSNAANHNAYFTSANAVLNTDISGHDVFVGKSDTADTTAYPNGTNFLTLTPAPPVVLTITTGAVVTGNQGGVTYPDGQQNYGASAFGNNGLVVNGGSTDFTRGRDTSTVSITGGSSIYADAYNRSTTSISGGTLNTATSHDNATVNLNFGSSPRFAYSMDNSTTNINSGQITGSALAYNNSIMNVGINSSIDRLGAFDNSTVNVSGGYSNNAFEAGSAHMNISGGFLPDGLNLTTGTATANFIGTNLSYTYVSPGSKGDQFTISGVFNGNPNITYQLYVNNLTGQINKNPRQFTFNGMAITVPEASPLILLASGLALLGLRRRRNGCMTRERAASVP